jgi:alanyl-tRNA synthetase
MSDEQVREVQQAVNRAIDAKLAVHAEEVPLELARSIHGVRAVFGEHYPDPVRVVCIGAPLAEVLRDRENPRWREHSIEFCGGTHLANTSESRRLVIVQEQALAAGVRRITALTGPAALAAESSGRDLVERVEAAAGQEGEALSESFAELSRLADEVTLAAVDRRAIIQQLDGLRERVKAVRKSARSSARDRVVEQARQIAEDADSTIIVATVQTAERDLLLAAMDALRARQSHAAIMLFGPDEAAQRVTIVASVPEALVQRGLKAGQWVGQAARICGGGGGGRPDKAQAGGKDPAQVPAAMEAAALHAEQALEGAGHDAAS